MSIFQWNEEKRLKTLKERGLDFADAEKVFSDEYVFFGPDPRYSTDDRWLLIGKLRDLIVVIAYKEIDADVYRIISMRRATETEVQRYKTEKINRLPSPDDPLVKLLEQLEKDRE